MHVADHNIHGWKLFLDLSMALCCYLRTSCDSVLNQLSPLSTLVAPWVVIDLSFSAEEKVQKAKCFSKGRKSVRVIKGQSTDTTQLYLYTYPCPAGYKTRYIPQESTGFPEGSYIPLGRDTTNLTILRLF